MRVLCLCRDGNVRSVALARMLKSRGHEALAAGVSERFSDETLIMLLNWAERVYPQADAYALLLERAGMRVLSESLGTFDLRFDVGIDDWKQPDAPGLIEALRSKLRLEGAP